VAAQRSGAGRQGDLGESDGYYHYYPTMEQVRAWLADAGFVTVEEAKGPWDAESMPITTCWPAWRPPR
jgi:hypothetical protein